MSLTKEEEKEFEDFYWERGKYQNRELGIDEYKSFIANLTHSREQKLIEKVIEALPEIEKAHTYASENAEVYRAYDKGQEDYKKRAYQAIIKIREIK